MINLKTLTLGIAVSAFAVSFANTAAAAEYWRWKGEDGVIHYGSTPPKGVDAEKVKTYGGVSRSAETQSDGASSSDGAKAAQPEEELTPEMQARRDARCKEERDRLAVFKRPGRIRMTQADGSTKYMSEQEIAQEIAITNQVIADTCQ